MALPNYREDIMTLAQRLEQKGLKKGLEEGEHRKTIAIAAIAKKLLDEGRSPGAVQKLTGLSEKEIMALVDKH
ncbi:MAG: transposase [Gammaproteobacteria bacterium]|nr:MAG: transposase [Gammaproteobacteria bacterium]